MEDSVIENMEAVLQITQAPQLEPFMSMRLYRETGLSAHVHIEYAPITKLELPLVPEGESAASGIMRQRLRSGYATGTFGPLPNSVMRELGTLLHQKTPLRLPSYTGTDPRLLFYSPTITGETNLLVVAEEGVRFSQFSNERLVDVKDADLPMPRCILRVLGNDMMLFALKSSEIVTDESPLYVPPTLNVSVTGEICVGDMTRPKAQDYKSAEKLAQAYVENFFLSKGSHEHGAGLQVLTNSQKLVDLYRDFIQHQVKVFPEHLLLPVPKTCRYQTVGDLRAELIRQL